MRLRRLIIQFFTFSIIGIGGFVVDASVYQLLYSWAGEVASRLVSFSLAVFFTYTLNNLITFRDISHYFWTKFPAYFVSMLGGGFVNLLTFFLVNRFFLLDPSQAYLSIALGSLAGLFFNFFASLLVFKKKRIR